jgi:hypothetical protein
VWAVTVLPIILLAGIVVDPLLVIWVLAVCIPVFTAAPAAALIFFVVNLFRRRWRAAVSIVVACAAFFLLVEVSLVFRDELKWHVWQDYYVAQLDSLQDVPGKVRSVP